MLLGASFKVWAPHASAVRVELKRASGSAETLDMVKWDNNLWHSEAASAAPGDDYRYALESTWNDCFATEGNTLFRRDPYARYGSRRKRVLPSVASSSSSSSFCLRAGLRAVLLRVSVSQGCPPLLAPQGREVPLWAHAPHFNTDATTKKN
jgi:hypothetical protein